MELSCGSLFFSHAADHDSDKENGLGEEEEVRQLKSQQMEPGGVLVCDGEARDGKHRMLQECPVIDNVSALPAEPLSLGPLWGSPVALVDS